MVVHACTDRRCALQAKERSWLEAQLAEAEQRLAAAQREREEEEARLIAATDSVEGARLARENGSAGVPLAACPRSLRTKLWDCARWEVAGCQQGVALCACMVLLKR